MDRKVIGNLARNATRPGYLAEMSRKIWLRVRGQHRGADQESVREALGRLQEPVEVWARAQDARLWSEAEEFSGWLENHAGATLATIDADLGGGGDYRLLYFLVRWLRPEVVVESGVAAGFSTTAILKALEGNGAGRLCSSDFPYFRLEDPERYVGFLVPGELKDRWTLDTRGDRKALPTFVSDLDHIDLVHYDSDKSAPGRKFAMELLAPLLTAESIVVMDDIDDDAYFLEWSSQPQFERHVFEFGGKHVGLVRLSERVTLTEWPIG